MYVSILSILSNLMLTYLLVSEVVHGQDHGDVVTLGQGLEPAPQAAHVRHLFVLPGAAGQQSVMSL